MTIDKAKFEGALAQIGLTEDSVIDLENSTHDADANDPYEEEFTSVHTLFSNIRQWANQKILEANQEQVMNGFLSELKVVFDKYAAKLEVGSSESGYGSSYGTGETVGVKLTAVLDGITASKEINKSVIVGSDLV